VQQARALLFVALFLTTSDHGEVSSTLRIMRSDSPKTAIYCVPVHRMHSAKVIKIAMTCHRHSLLVQQMQLKKNLHSVSHHTPLYTLPPTPYTLQLHPTTCTLHPAPYTLHPTPYTLHPAPYDLHPTPYTLHPAPCTLHPTTCNLNAEP